MTEATELRPGSPEEAGLDPDRIEIVRKRCREWVDDGTHPALVVLVARRGVIAFHEAFGTFGPEPDASPLTVDAIFPIASISKTVVSTVVMTLVQDGLIGLTRPVQEYIPEFTGAEKELVCVHHLLTHTSGLRDVTILAALIERLGTTEIPPKEKTEHTWVHAYMSLGYDVPLARPAGEDMSYCTYNYDLLAEIVRRVSGCRFTDVADERVFSPLGMDDTFYILPDELFDRAVRREPRAVLPGSPPWDSRESRRLPWPSTGVFSTARDLAVFVQMFLQRGTYNRRRILGRSSVEEMTRNQIPGMRSEMWNSVEASWSYTWTMADGQKWLGYPAFRPGVFNHMGQTGTFAWGDPHDELVCVYLSVPTQYLPIPESVLEEPVFNADLFANAVYAAMED
jgi:CubicO group peptidase (beta-lactamase class C family)